MNNEPIGIFDSGIGGLTVMAEVMRFLPSENIVYFGDTAHVPYGSKSKEAVTRFSVEIANFLLSKNVKMIVVACNTASAFALGTLRRKFALPVIGVIEPGARAAVESTKSKRIGVVGTEGTVQSRSYPAAIAAKNASVKVFSRACPLFVPLVEEGWLTHDVTHRVAREYIAPLAARNIDTLVLGCTHYPLLKTVLRAAAGPAITLIDSAAATAGEVSRTLHKNGRAAPAGRRGKYQFYVSDAPEKFQAAGRRFLGRAIAGVKKITMEKC